MSSRRCYISSQLRKFLRPAASDRHQRSVLRRLPSSRLLFVGRFDLHGVLEANFGGQRRDRRVRRVWGLRARGLLRSRRHPIYRLYRLFGQVAL